MKRIYQLKINLRYASPPVWRRIEIISGDTFHDLHIAIQDCMKWEDSHLHAFRVNGLEITHPDFEIDCNDLNECTTAINSIFTENCKNGEYTYDFGDCWEHAIILEKILPLDKDKKYPRCTAGRGNTFEEDYTYKKGEYEKLPKFNYQNIKFRDAK